MRKFFLVCVILGSLVQTPLCRPSPSHVSVAESKGASKAAAKRYGRGTLPWFSYPLTPEEFNAKYFENHPVLLDRNDHRAYFGPELGNIIDALQHTAYKPNPRLTGKNNYNFPTIRATKLGKDVAPFLFWNKREIAHAFPKKTIEANRRAYVPRQAWDQAAIEYTHGQGFSTVYSGAQYYEDGVVRPFLKMVTVRLGIWAQMNVYHTPGKNKGFKSHFDSHDVFVLQLAGSKRWRVYKQPPTRLPSSDWPLQRVTTYMGGKRGRRTPLFERVLKQGDALYIPRGFIHDADCNSLPDDSVHLTVGFEPPLWVDLLHFALRHVLAEDAMGDELTVALKHFLKKGETAEEDMVQFRASPLLPFAVNASGVSNVNFNTYKSILDDFISTAQFRDATKGIEAADRVGSTLRQRTTWGAVLARYRASLHELFERGKAAMPAYKPVSHDAQEIRPITSYNGRGRKRKRKHRKRKGKK